MNNGNNPFNVINNGNNGNNGNNKHKYEALPVVLESINNSLDRLDKIKDGLRP